MPDATSETFLTLCNTLRLHFAPFADGVRCWPHGVNWFCDGADYLAAANLVLIEYRRRSAEES